MQSTSELWKTLYSDNQHYTEYKLKINNVEYYSNKIISLESSCDIFNGGSPLVGQCVSAQMKASLYLPTNSIPRKSKCELFVRLVKGNQVSEWLPQGTYFINKRKTNKNTGVLTIETYDSMIKGDKTMYTSSGQQEDWPKKDIDILSEIASDFLEVELDPSVESIVVNEYEVQYPGYGDEGYTVKQILGYIGAMYGGNWIITDNNKLKLLLLKDFPHKAPSDLILVDSDEKILIDLNEKILMVEDSSGPSERIPLIEQFTEDFYRLIDYPTISKIILTVGYNEDDGETIQYVVGDDTHEIFEVECPWGTEAMANNLLNDISEFVYRPYNAVNVVVNPAFELWDGVFSEDEYSGITSYSRYFESLYTADISASGEEELDSEYPYISSEDLKNRMNNAKTRASLIVNSDRISSVVADTNNIGTRVTQTEKDITAIFNDVTNTQNPLSIISKLDTHASNQVKYIRYSAAGIELGDENGRYKAILSNTELDFLDGDTVATWISNKILHVNTAAEIGVSLQIGDWILLQLDDNSLALKFNKK